MSEDESKTGAITHASTTDRTHNKQTTSDNPNEDHGYYFYPQRNNESQEQENKSIFAKYSPLNLKGRNNMRHTFKCFTNVYSCMQKDPKVKLLISALKNAGCPVDVSRHISCEDCLSRVNGGFDPQQNQIVVCQNNSQKREVCCNVLSHELTHMFDYCRAKVDFTNLEHLACTEIRAANFMHCSFLSSLADGHVSPLHVKKQHQECVKQKALMSMVVVRDITEDEARSIVNKVFTRCYNDLEPFGRVPRRNSNDPQRMYSEGYLYGYCD